jgi:hypothetical protein
VIVKVAEHVGPQASGETAAAVPAGRPTISKYTGFTVDPDVRVAVIDRVAALPARTETFPFVVSE